MTVHSLIEALEDSAALKAMADESGLTLAQMRKAMAVVGRRSVLQMRQVLRIATTADDEEKRQVNRATRRGECAHARAFVVMNGVCRDCGATVDR